jgi:hypothetical protein
MTRRQWGRRSVLLIGVAALGGMAWPAPAGANVVSVGDLSFTVPPTISPSPPTDDLGEAWQWQGRTPGSSTLPATVVLARADVAATDPEEVLGLVLAGSVSGLLADLQLTSRRSRPMPGGGDQTRVGLQYTAGQDLAYHGELLIATRQAPPAGLLVVLGDDQLTAGTIDSVLESARWRP